MIKWNSKEGVCDIVSVESDKQIKLKNQKPLVYQKMVKFPQKVMNGESIAIIQFQYDYKCNMKCQHCCIKPFQMSKIETLNDKRQIFNIERVKQLSKQADQMGLAHFVITGGQPLIFSDFDQLVKAIDPNKFFITSDTNGYLLDYEKAKHLKEIGIDKIQLSLDGMDEKQHDQFRRTSGSWKRCIKAIQYCKAVGLDIIIQTVVWKERLKSQQFINFLQFGKINNVPIFVSLAKPVGAWQGRFDILLNNQDLQYLNCLRQKYNVFTHLTPAYGLDLGCIGVKKIFSITKYGEVMPCPYIHVSLGNVFKQNLKTIINRGLHIKQFGQYNNTCWVAIDKDFIMNKLTKTYDKQLPIGYREIFNEEDLIKE